MSLDIGKAREVIPTGPSDQNLGALPNNTNFTYLQRSHDGQEQGMAVPCNSSYVSWLTRKLNDDFHF